MADQNVDHRRGGAEAGVSVRFKIEILCASYVIICNANPVRKSVVMDNGTLGAKFDRFLNESVKYEDANLEQRQNRGLLRRVAYDSKVGGQIINAKNNVFSQNVQIRYSQVGHQIKDMLVSCRADDLECFVSDFVYVPNVPG